MRRDFSFVNHRHFRIWQREKNDICATHSLGCIDNFKTGAPRRHARFAFAIQPNDDGDPAVAQVQCVRVALRAETDHSARFSLEPAKVAVFIGVNARRRTTPRKFVHRVLL
jgi:hypothetical protein